MSNPATKTDIKSAIKLIKGLSSEAGSPEQQYHLALAAEALENVETQYHYRQLNKKATKEVRKLYQTTSGTTGTMWDYVLGLLEKDRLRRGG